MSKVVHTQNYFNEARHSECVPWCFAAGFGSCEACCVRLADQRDLIAVAKLNETLLDVFVPCNEPAAPGSISWTTEHLVHRLLPPPSFHRPLTDAISSHLHRQLDEGSIRLCNACLILVG